MRKFLSALFKKISEMLEKPDSQEHLFEKEETDTTPLLNKKFLETSREEEQRAPIEETHSVIDELSLPKVKKTRENTLQKKKTAVIHYPDKHLRDVIDLMEFPFVALSKDRINPIVYESEDKTQKVVISGHRGHFIASIYDWDIILIVAGKIQEILNNGSDIPSRKITIPRHELLKALHREGGRKQQKDLEKSLARLQLTGINTTINNKDGRYVEGFGFIESWRYAERKSDRETKIIQITLSEWLYELCCAQGSLLKSNSLYFDITSGLQKFLYRTARKHAGQKKDGWEFSLEKLYEKSGSEGNFRKFKSKLKAAVIENSLPDYFMKWIERKGKIFVEFKKRYRIDEIDRIVEKHEENKEQMIEFSKADNLP
jgi:plasmid replication initiation protein